MSTCRMGGPIRAGRRAVWAGIAAFGLFGAVGCQVEYAGMTLPTGKYLYDDVQYFAEGPHFPLANTLAATQRAQMQAQGIDPMGAPPVAGMAPAGALGGPIGGVITPPPGAMPPGGMLGPGGQGMAPGGPGAFAPGGRSMIQQVPGGGADLETEQAQPPILTPPPDRMMQPEMVPPPGPGF